MKAMKAIRCREWGAPDVLRLEEAESPSLERHQVRIRVHAAGAVVPIPDAMDFVTAAAFPVAYGTSHFALTHRGHLLPGETLLVLGAAGGVGLTAVEIGKALGARVIAAAGGMEK